MNEYEQYSYLTAMCDPYISYEVINGELKKVFKDEEKVFDVLKERMSIN